MSPPGASGMKCLMPVYTLNDSRSVLIGVVPKRGSVSTAFFHCSSVEGLPRPPRRLLHTRVQPPPSFTMSQYAWNACVVEEGRSQYTPLGRLARATCSAL